MPLRKFPHQYTGLPGRRQSVDYPQNSQILPDHTGTNVPNKPNRQINFTHDTKNHPPPSPPHPGSKNPGPNLHRPKVELHLHLDCSLSYTVVHQLDPKITPEEYNHQFIAPPVCTNLADYITRADRSVDLMQTQKALRLVTLDLFNQLKKDHVIYAEMRFAPLKHLNKGLTAEQVVAAVDSAVAEGTRRTGIQAGVILCTLRQLLPANKA
ncbi:hypothetical protein ACQ86N_24105 [Puia sp. P3]|uniref:hypothetical protein n=1 Tax=Puia sp. P3 TaxID=3423952 RepID=UPI003D67A940